MEPYDSIKKIQLDDRGMYKSWIHDICKVIQSILQPFGVKK